MKFNTFLANLPDYERSGEQNVFSQRSNLWSHIVAQRLDLETASEAEAMSAFATFLAPGSHQATGISDWAREIDDGLRAFLEARLSSDMLAHYPAPPTGAPEMFSLHGQQTYMAHTWNLMTFGMFKQQLDHHGPAGPLNVVEIGAGYGSAALSWIRSGRVRSYVIIDLIDNLPNSGFFLRENLPDWSFELVRLGDKIELREKTIYALCPSHIAALDDVTFDMAVNSDSLGEMPRDTARNYVAWVAKHLRPGGVFLSKNGHCRAAGHTKSYSDYGYQALNLRHLGYANYCSSAFDDFSHVTLLEKADPDAGTNWTPQRLQDADALANAFRCGFGADLTPVLDRFSQDAVVAEDHALLAQFTEFFTDPASATGPSNPASALQDVLRYLAGLSGAKAGQAAAHTYLAEGQSLMGRVYGYFALLKAGGPIDPKALDAEDPMVRHYVAEMRRELGRGALKRWIVFQIRAENIRRKIRPSQPYTPSALMKLKNLVMNLREGRSVSFYRGE